jgi:hypothetical protein
LMGRHLIYRTAFSALFLYHPMSLSTGFSYHSILLYSLFPLSLSLSPSIRRADISV